MRAPVELGQVWADRDPRPADRRLCVVDFERPDIVVVKNVRTGRTSRIRHERLTRFYELQESA